MNAEEQLDAKLKSLDPDYTCTYNHLTRLHTCTVVIEGNRYSESSLGKLQAMAAIVTRFRDRIAR